MILSCLYYVHSLKNRITKYRFAEKEGIYFTTATVVGWADVFTRDIYRDIVLERIRFCQQNQGLAIHAWVLMTNHLHLIGSFLGKPEPALVLKNRKRYPAMKLIDGIIKTQKKAGVNMY
jgi:putative transposase